MASTANYTEAQSLSVTHARISYRTREITSVVYERNAENGHTKMADYRALVSMGTLQLSSKRSHYTKNAFFKH